MTRFNSDSSKAIFCFADDTSTYFMLILHCDIGLWALSPVEDPVPVLLRFKSRGGE